MSGICRMSFLWKQRTQEEKEQKKNLEDVNQLLLESILPTKVSKYYMEEDQSAVSPHHTYLQWKISNSLTEESFRNNEVSFRA